MNVAAHWLDDDFKPHIKCLSVKPIASTADSVSTAAVLSDVIEEWSLNRSNLHHVTVNCTNDMNEELSQVVNIVIVLVQAYPGAQLGCER